MPEPFNHPFLSRGFRPFFAIGAIYTVISILTWILHWNGVALAPAVFDDPVLWHGHEMIYGFTMAIIAGFLLTAVANWTGGAPARHIHLFLLCLVWFAGRVVMNVPGIPYGLVAAIDLAFIPILAVSLAIPLLRSWNKRNFVFLLMLTILFFGNLSLFVFQDKTALYAVVLIVISMISLVGGRIIPAFTVAALRRKGARVFQKDQPRADIVALVSLVCLLVSVVTTGFDGMVPGFLAFMSAAVHLWRLRSYHTGKVWHDPMLWSLHLGYYWLIAGLVCLGLSGFGFIVPTVALHALTAGCIGMMTLSMMCRVALGHTGRNLIAGRLTVFSFVCMLLAAFIRVCGPLFLPELHMQWILLSGGLWALAFVLYLFVYLPVLWMPRPDSRT